MTRLLIFDLDGVIYRGDEILPHAVETLREMRAAGHAVRFLSNNSTRTRDQFRDKLRRMGVEAESDEVTTTAHATRVWLESNAPEAKLYIIGESGLREELAKFDLLPRGDSLGATHVIVGYDREFTFRDCGLALEAIQRGAELIVTNRDPNFPAEGGRISPGGGAIVACVETAAEIEGRLIGKPDPRTVLQIISEAGADPADVLLIGDRPATDIAAGRRAGVRTCLVLTGVTNEETAKHLPPELRPDHVIADLRGLPPIAA